MRKPVRVEQRQPTLQSGARAPASRVTHQIATVEAVNIPFAIAAQTGLQVGFRRRGSTIQGAALAIVFADVDGNRPCPLCSHDRHGNCRATGATIEPDMFSCFRLLRHPGLQQIADLGIVSTLSTQFSRSYFIEPHDESLLDGSLAMSAKL